MSAMSTANNMAVFTCLVLLLSGCHNNDRSAGIGSYPSTSEPLDTPTADSPEPEKPEADEDGFAVVNHFPQAGDDNIALVSPISVTFNEPLMTDSYSSELLRVSLDNTTVSGTQQRVDSKTVQFIPDGLLQPDATYQVRVSDQVMSQSGQVPNALEWQFKTVGDVHTTSQDIIDQCMSARDIEMLAAVNAVRVTSRNCGEDAMNAVDKLEWNCDLQSAALHHAQDMSENDFFSHTGSDGSSAGDRATNVGYRWSLVGENIAAGQSSVADVMSAWLDSPGHCRNLMSPNYTQFGFGYSTNDDSYYQRYWAQIFARPRN